MQVSPVWFLGQEDPLEKGYRPPTPVFLDFPCGSAGKKSTYNARDLGSIPGLGRSPGEGKGYPLQYSGLENSRDCIVHGVAKSRTLLGNFHLFLLLLHQLHLRSSSIIRSWRSGTPALGEGVTEGYGFQKTELTGGLLRGCLPQGLHTGLFVWGHVRQRWLFTVHWSLWFQTLLPKPQISFLHCTCEVNILVFEMLTGSGYLRVPSSVFWGDIQ